MRTVSKKTIYITCLAVFLTVVLGYCLYNIMSGLNEYAEAESAYDNLSESMISDVSEETESTDTYEMYRQILESYKNPEEQLNASETPETTEDKAEQSETKRDPDNIPQTEDIKYSFVPKQIINIDHSSLSGMNKDYIGWLYYDLANVNYPLVTDTTGSGYYLTHLFNGKANSAGSCYITKGEDRTLQADYILIHGHNMKDGSIFGRFKVLYRDSMDAVNGSKFYIVTPDNVTHVYTVFAVDQTLNSSRIYTPLDDYNDRLASIKETSQLYNPSLTASKGNIIGLSTCYGAVGGNERLVIFGMETETIPSGKALAE